MPLIDMQTELDYGGKLTAGVDEVGRGCLAGCLAAAAVILDPKNIPENIDDSKRLSAKNRERVFKDIIERAVAYKVMMIEVAIIDQINIQKAALSAMRNAIMQLSVRPDVVLVDGLHAPQCQDMKIIPVIGADAFIASVAAASIVAKVYRDRVMCDLHQKYPQYQWNKNMGYGTAAHINAVKEHGITEHHRKSFAPVKYMLR